MPKLVSLLLLCFLACQTGSLIRAAEELDVEEAAPRNSVQRNRRALPIILAAPGIFSALVGIGSGLGTAVTGAATSVSAYGGLLFGAGTAAGTAGLTAGTAAGTAGIAAGTAVAAGTAAGTVGAGIAAGTATGIAAGTAVGVAAGAGAAAATGTGFGISLQLPTAGQVGAMAVASAVNLKVLLANIQASFVTAKDQVQVIVNGIEAVLPAWMVMELQAWILQQEKETAHATAKKVREKVAEWWQNSRVNPWRHKDESTTTAPLDMPEFVAPRISSLPAAHVSNLAKDN